MEHYLLSEIPRVVIFTASASEAIVGFQQESGAEKELS